MEDLGDSVDTNSTSKSSGSTECYVVPLPAQVVPLYWQVILPFVSMALAEGRGELEPDDVYARLCDGRMQVLAAVYEDTIVAALVTEVVNYPRKTALRVVLAGGSKLDKWMHAAQAMLLIGAHAVGASFIEMHGRKGWQKALLAVGWKPSYYSMAFEVDDEHT